MLMQRSITERTNPMAEIHYDVSNGEPIFIGEYFTFDVYFAGIVAMQEHPGAGTKDHVKLTLEQCRDKAIDMLKLRRAIPVFEPMQPKEEVNE